MRYMCHLKLSCNSRRMPVWLSLLTGVSLLAITVTSPAYAQGGEFVVDVSDPNVSVDLSVLSDGGVGPQMGAMVPGAMPGVAAPSYSGAMAPGPNLPVSTLYIQPSAGFTLPPQTKAMIAQPEPEPQPEPEMDVVEDTPLPAAPEEPAVEETLAEAVPPAPVVEPVTEPIAGPAQTSQAEELQPMPAPADVAVQVPAPEPVAEPLQEVAVAPDSTPDTAPISAVSQEPVSEPAAGEPAGEVAAEQTPPPPPQALSQSASDVTAAIDEAQDAAPQDTTGATASPSGVVVALPPKLEELQPGVASLPPSTGPLSDGDNMRIVFENDSSKLPSDAREALKTLSGRMNQQDGLRLQLLAYAGGTDTSASAARRLSLSRALAVRSYLIENGVRSTRIDVRALGNKSTEAVTERVDITIVER